MAINLNPRQKEIIYFQYLKDKCSTYGFRIKNAGSPFCMNSIKYIIQISKSGTLITDDLFKYLESQVITPYLEELKTFSRIHPEYPKFEPLVSLHKHPKLVSDSYVILSLESKLPSESVITHPIILPRW